MNIEHFSIFHGSLPAGYRDILEPSNTMSKPISFGFGKPKAQASGPSKPTTSISLPSRNPTGPAKPSGLKSRSALQTDEDEDRDEDQPKHESVTGFSSTGAILSKPVEEKKAIVIENQGNGDWRRRGRGAKNILPGEERARREDQDVVMVEKNEVSTASGLQLAPIPIAEDTAASVQKQSLQITNGHQANRPKTVDEEALQALLDDDPSAPRSNAIISVSENKQLRPADELEDFRSDVATRPDASTLDEYAAMPVEEFGLAMLRGMGKKRRANGEVINVEPEPDKKKEIKKPKHEGFLGIGAKPAPGLEGVELGAWGKADMRKNNKGQGFFTPVMIRNRETGETITEEELERRKKVKSGKDEPEDWKTRRERNLEKDGHARNGGDGGYRDAMNGFSRRRKDEDSGHESSHSRRDGDRERDSDYDTSRSKRPRSRSRERRYKDEDRYDSSSSRRDKERSYDRDRDRDRHRDRHKERDRDYDRDSRRHRDRR